MTSGLNFHQVDTGPKQPFCSFANGQGKMPLTPHSMRITCRLKTLKGEGGAGSRVLL